MNLRLKLALIFSTALLGVDVVEARTKMLPPDPSVMIEGEIRTGKISNQEIEYIYQQIEGKVAPGDIKITREKVATYFNHKAYPNHAFRKKETADYLECLTQKKIDPIADYYGFTLTGEQIKNTNARAAFFGNISESTRKMLTTRLKNSVQANEPAR